MREPLTFSVRTPSEVVFEGPVRSARVPTETGQVGLRPGGEALVLAIEAGLLVLATPSGEVLVATSGGLLEGAGDRCTVLTPFALRGDTEAELEVALASVMSTPPAELVARARLEELEQRILGELGQRGAGAARRVDGGAS